jgi:hypothetical protein
VLAARHGTPCAALFWPAHWPFRGALAATMVGLTDGRPFAFPGAVVVEPGVYTGGYSTADYMRASRGLQTAREAAPKTLASFNRQIILLDGRIPIGWRRRPR